LSQNHTAPGEVIDNLLIILKKMFWKFRQLANGPGGDEKEDGDSWGGNY
jgi:hypothetical protein